MKLVKGSSTLVIVGAWNPAILQPDWIARNALQIQTGAPIPMTMEFGPGIGFLPRLNIDGVTVAPFPDRLLFGLDSLDVLQLARLEDAGHRTLSALSHTPVTAFGENFDFVEDDPTEEQLGIFDHLVDLSDRVGERFEPVATALKQSVQLDGRTLNLTRELNGNSFFIRFNFHYSASSAADAAALLGGQFERNYQVVLNVLRSYQIDINELLRD